MSDLLRPKDAIQRLENDPRGVPATLEAGGFRGERENCAACPVALYMLKATGMQYMDVGEDMIIFFPYSHDYGSFAPPSSVEHTPPFIEKFVNRFDHGDYPELDEELEHLEWV